MAAVVDRRTGCNCDRRCRPGELFRPAGGRAGQPFFPVGQTFRPPAHDFLCRRHPVGRRANHLRTLPRHAGRIERGRRICRRIGIFIFGVEKEIN